MDEMLLRREAQRRSTIRVNSFGKLCAFQHHKSKAFTRTTSYCSFRLYFKHVLSDDLSL